MKQIIQTITEVLSVGGIITVSWVFMLLQILFVWGWGLYIAIFGIALLLEGSILGGLFVLFIGVPVVLAIAQLLFPFWAIFTIIYLIYLIITNLL